MGIATMVGRRNLQPKAASFYFKFAAYGCKFRLPTQYALPIIKATVAGYFRITADLLPTPSKCHYTFNLRDPAKMVQGMMMCFVKTSLNNPDDLFRLWHHEAARCFRDRLINDIDK